MLQSRTDSLWIPVGQNNPFVDLVSQDLDILLVPGLWEPSLVDVREKGLTGSVNRAELSVYREMSIGHLVDAL
jgi:hypothetical protein